MDGQLVASRSVGRATLARAGHGGRTPLHLMVKRPLRWLGWAAANGFREVIIPVESADLPSAIGLARQLGLRLTLAINPRTPLHRLIPWLGSVQRVQCLAVLPGAYGRPFQTAVLDRLTWLSRRRPRLQLSVDGGVTLDRVPALLRRRVEQLVVGSAVMLAANPRAAFREFQRAVRHHPEGR